MLIRLHNLFLRLRGLPPIQHGWAMFSRKTGRMESTVLPTRSDLELVARNQDPALLYAVPVKVVPTKYPTVNVEGLSMQPLAYEAKPPQYHHLDPDVR